MKLNNLYKALAIAIASISSASAATYTVDFDSLIGSYSEPLAVTDFLTISYNGGGFSIDSTDIFSNPVASLSNFDSTPYTFVFDTTKVDVSSVSLGGISNNAGVPIDGFGSILDTSIDTTNNWSEISTISGIGSISQIDVTLFEGSLTSFVFDYENVAPVPVPAAVWLFGSGLIGLVGVARRKQNA